jgi:ketosteroid isomerase-like protein
MRDWIDDLVGQWCAAERSGDAQELGTLLTGDFVGVGPVGFVLDKAAWLGRFSQGLTYDDLSIDELVVRAHGDAAVVVAHQHTEGRSGEVPLPADLRMSMTVVTEDGGVGRIACMQYSFIGPPPGPR